MRLAPRLSAVLVLALAIGVGVALSSDAADPGALRKRLEAAEGRERSLERQLARLAALDRSLERQAAAFERRQAEVQADLERDEAQLERLRADLRRERARALRLRRRLAEAREALATRLVERYKAADVDALSVVLGAASFADLMERAAFLRRVQRADEKILVAVREARADAIRERRRLDAAEERQRRVVAGLRARRNAIASMAAAARARRAALQRVRAARARALSAARRDRGRLERDLRAAEREAARAARSGQAGGSGAAGASGGWAIPWPVVQCESGGQNLPPNAAGASGYYQIMPETWKGMGGRGPHAYLRPKAEQDAIAAKLWNGGKGASNWVCAAIVGIG